MPKKNIILLLVILLVIILIGVGAYFFINKNNNSGSIISIGENKEIFDMQGYTCKAVMYINSNKNSNEYQIEQSADLVNKKYRLNTDIMDIIYKENKLLISSQGQKSTYEIEDYNPELTNLVFIDSFIENYNNKENNSSKKEIDGKVLYKTKININKSYAHSESLEIDKNSGKPIKLTVYDKNENVYLDIIYTEFIINPTFLEKIFDF